MPSLASVGRFIAHNPGTVAGLGAGLGAAANVGREALSGSPEKHYLGAAVRGAAVGGALGGATGGIARAARDTTLLRPELTGAGDVAKATAQRAGQGLSNFAQRQFHGLTGFGGKDPAYLDRIGLAGSNTSLARNRLGNLRAEDLAKHNPAKAEKIFEEAGATAKGIAQEGEIGDKLRGLGMTSAPGAVKAMATNPREASRAIWDQLRAGGKAGVALGVGVPLATHAASIAKGDESAHGGQTVGEKVLRAGANVGGGLVFGGLPVISNMVAGGLTEAAAGGVGRALTPRRAPVAPVIADAAPRIG